MTGGYSEVEIALDARHAGWRLDRALAASIPALSRERLKVLTKSGALTRGGKAVRDPAIKVNGDERFTLAIPDPQPAHNEPQEIPLPIVYEDLAANPAETALRILDHLGLPRPAAPWPPSWQHQRQSDARTDTWVRRFEAQSHQM